MGHQFAGSVISRSQPHLPSESCQASREQQTRTVLVVILTAVLKRMLLNCRLLDQLKLTAMVVSTVSRVETIIKDKTAEKEDEDAKRSCNEREKGIFCGPVK